MSKMQKALVASGVTLIVAVLIIISVVVFVNRNASSDTGNDVETMTSQESEEVTSTEIVTEIKTEPVTEEVANNIENNVGLSIDFKFDTKVSGNFYTVEEKVVEEKDIFEEEPTLEFRKHSDVDDLYFLRLDTDHLMSVDTSVFVNFVGQHSEFRATIEELPMETTYEDLRRKAFGAYPWILNKIGMYDIPFGTPYELGKGFVNPDKLFEKTWDGSYDYIQMFDNYQVIFDTSVETEMGVVYLIGVYNIPGERFYVDGYVKHENGRCFVVHGNDTTDQYLVAYISDLMDNCIVMLE